ncbi:MAG: tRNA preQ1(34) S-adenosylmethionine ribosyltransferase-isomerase QueA [Pseudomonadota bacterium]
MKLSDCDFDLPEGLIATRPAQPRSSARLLCAEGGGIADRRVSDLPLVLRPGDHLVLNDTRVIPARLSGRRYRKSTEDSGAQVELTLLEPMADGQWSAMAKPLRKLKPGDSLQFGAGLTGAVVAVGEGLATVIFDLTGPDFDTALNAAGAMPLPPYIAAKRAADDRDRTDYQTVWARAAGAVAAPTASLHFDTALLAALKARGVGMSYVTLHVGAGTFLPVKVDDIEQHRMHAERGEITKAAAAEINAAKIGGGRIIPVGTTALRLIETVAAKDGRLSAWQGATDIFIRPGFEFKITDGLMTNFHLPKSTLMMLVSALMGQENVDRIYRHAIAEEYRFFSYGDASLLFPVA